MLEPGDIHIYVTDVARAVRFWADGMQLEIAEKEITAHSGFARLDFPGGLMSLHLVGPVDPWIADQRPEHGTRPSISFDVATDDFDATLVRLIENGGTQLGEIETYNALRVVSIADPDGNIFELLEIPPDEE